MSILSTGFWIFKIQLRTLVGTETPRTLAIFTWISRMQKSQLNETIKNFVPISPWQIMQTSSMLLFKELAGSIFATTIMNFLLDIENWNL
jgi:hypothetical protein